MAFEGWIASLSNGETVFEEWIPGQPSPWLRLLQRLEEEGLAVTQLRLQVRGRTYCCIPHADAYFQAHRTSMSLYGKQRGFLRGIGSVVGDTVYILWVNEQGDCWQEVRRA
ncbi:MAG: hypothetical protein DRN91_08285 [Candidatus Alkanophagales archaeon]|nr:MAG: hypothetical protein DRN91_08285 [Candidatus Alkanophagales archaeon]